MFAGAAREVVFSNPEVVRKINEEFIPVALKAGLVNNPPRGVEGDLYAEIARSKPAPQGICTVNSAGKVLAWALSFDDDASIPKFLDHVVARYKQSPGGREPVVAERFRKFPSRKLADVRDSQERIKFPERHATNRRCPAKPAVEKGTLVGRIIGRPLDASGKPIAETIRQEHYMEARFQIPVELQEALAAAVKKANGKRFRIPNRLARGLVTHAYLGQLDVNPLGGVPGSRNDSRKWEFFGQQTSPAESGTTKVRVDGESRVEGGQKRGARRSGDGRLWEHRVELSWQGYVDMKDDRMTHLAMLADGHERLRWGNARFNLLAESDAEHLMAGHPIDLSCSVRYGLVAKPAPADEVVEGAAERRGQRRARAGAQVPERIRAKMQRLQAGLQRRRQAGGQVAPIVRLMQQFGPLMNQQKYSEAEAVLDRALKRLDEDRS